MSTTEGDNTPKDSLPRRGDHVRILRDFNYIRANEGIVTGTIEELRDGKPCTYYRIVDEIGDASCVEAAEIAILSRARYVPAHTSEVEPDALRAVVRGAASVDDTPAGATCTESKPGRPEWICDGGTHRAVVSHSHHTGSKLRSWTSAAFTLEERTLLLAALEPIAAGASDGAEAARRLMRKVERLL